MTGATSNNWYQFFMEPSESHDWILVTVFGLRAFWAAIGILLNFGVIFVTIKNKDLHHVCNLLIALEAFFASFLNLNFFIPFGVVLSGLKFIRYESCFPWLFVPGIFGESAQLTMLLIGLERLSSVLLPIWYKSKSKLWCMGMASAAISLYALYNSVLLYLDFLQSKNVLVSCSSNEMIQSGIGTIMRVNTISISLCLVTVYILVWLISFMAKSHSAAMSESSKHLLKSLLIIIGLDLSCVCLKNVTMLSIKMFTSNSMVSSGLSVAFSFLTIAVYSANGPVLYLISTVYRNKFQKHFKFNWKWHRMAKMPFSQSQQVAPSPSPVQIHQMRNSAKSISRMVDVSQINPYPYPY